MVLGLMIRETWRRVQYFRVDLVFLRFLGVLCHPTGKGGEEVFDGILDVFAGIQSSQF